MLTLVFVRHGESIRNYLTDIAREGHLQLLQEHMRDCPEEASWPLTELGHEQARLAGDFVRTQVGDHFDVAHVSPFTRAKQTAANLGFEASFKEDDRLRERLWGDYDLRDYSPARYIEDLHHCSEPTWSTGLPNGESISDLEPEAASYLDDLPAEGRVIAVTHGGTLGAIQRVLEANPPHRPLGNCGVLHYEIVRSNRAWRGRGRFACPAFGDKEFGDWIGFG